MSTVPKERFALLKAARDMGNPTGEMTAAIGEPSELPDRTKQVSGSGFWCLYFVSAYIWEAGAGTRLVAAPFFYSAGAMTLPVSAPAF